VAVTLGCGWLEYVLAFLSSFLDFFSFILFGALEIDVSWFSLEMS
jgi:hypothetical protein